MTFEPAPAWDDELPVHRVLLDMAHELGPMANKGDHACLSDSASALLEVFVRHAEAERPMVARLPPITARLIEHGQRRVVDRLVSLVLQADLAEEPCRCVELADEIASLMEVQIMSEEWDQSDR